MINAELLREVDAGAGLALLAAATSVWSGVMSSSTMARAAVLTGARRAIWTLAGAAAAANGLWANYYLCALSVRGDLATAIGGADTAIAALSVHLACAFAFLMIVYRRTRTAELAGAAVLGANVFLMQYLGLRSFNLDPARLFDLAAFGPTAALLAAVFVASVLAFRPEVSPLRRFVGVAAASVGVTLLNLLILGQSPLAAGAASSDLTSGSLKSVVFIITCLLVVGIAAAYATDKLLAERDRHVRALDAALERLTASERAAKAANAAKSDFVADVSHEIRTPLTAILGMLDLLDAQFLSLDQRRQVAIAKTASEGLLSLANDLVDLAKLEAGKIVPVIAPCDIASIARAVIDLMRPTVTGRDVALRLEVDPGFPTAVLSDGARVRQILVNLVGNAVKFTERGAISVQLSAQQRDNGYELSLAVEDTGPGMSADAQARLFTRFAQYGSDSNAAAPGAGLGLAISERLANMLGGGLAVSSVSGTGSRFVLHLFATPAVAAPAVTSPSPVTALQRLPRPLHVLIVDDQEANRYLAERLLLRFGVTADSVSNAADALASLGVRRYDAVLLDLHMPNVDGFATADAIRALDGASRVPLIALSAAVGAADRRRCEAAGITHFVEKPIKAAALYSTLLDAVRQSSPEGFPPKSLGDTYSGEQEPIIDSDQLHSTIALIGAAEANALATAAFADIDRLLNNVRVAIANGELDKARSDAHAIKGIAANWAAARLAEEARRFDSLATDSVAAAATLDAMVRSLCATAAALPMYIAVAPTVRRIA